MGVVPFRKDSPNIQPEILVKLFLTFKKAQGISPRTIRDYEKTLGLYFKRFPDGLIFPRERTQEFLGAYENPCSFNLRYSYLKCFWDWALDEGFISGRHPLSGLRKRKPQGRIVQLTEGEVARLLKQPDRRTYTGLRDFAAMLLQVDCGIRPGEMLQLMPKDFSPTKGEVIVRASTAKTRTERALPVSEPTVQAIERLLSVRPASWGDAPIFSTQDGRPFSVPEYSRRVKRYGAACGLSITAYSLRHACALLMLRRGMSAFSLQSLLGHTSMQMTRHYVNLTAADVQREHQRAGVVPFILGDDAPPRRERLRKL